MTKEQFIKKYAKEKGIETVNLIIILNKYYIYNFNSIDKDITTIISIENEITWDAMYLLIVEAGNVEGITDKKNNFYSNEIYEFFKKMKIEYFDLHGITTFELRKIMQDLGIHIIPSNLILKKNVLEYFHGHAELRVVRASKYRINIFDVSSLTVSERTMRMTALDISDKIIWASKTVDTIIASINPLHNKNVIKYTETKLYYYIQLKKPQKICDDNHMYFPRKFKIRKTI